MFCQFFSGVSAPALLCFKCIHPSDIVLHLYYMQSQLMLSEIYPGASPKAGSTYWDQIHEVAIISVSRRVLKRLHEFLEEVMFSSPF